MLPSLPPIRHGSRARTAALNSCLAALTTRTFRESDRKPGGRGKPKLTNSRSRFGAFPSRVTSISVACEEVAEEVDESAARPANRDMRPVCKNDLRDKGFKLVELNARMKSSGF